MGLRVSTNTQSISAQRTLQLTINAQKASMEKLASGSRIYRAGDDAAGLAIAETMRSHIRSIRQDVRNANDGISLIQTAEGGMSEISNTLVRFRELSIQAASDTINDSERSLIDKEVQQLRADIDRIAFSTEYNGHKLLSGEDGLKDIQVGLGNNPETDRISFDPAKTNITAAALGVSDITVVTKEDAQKNLTVLDESIGRLMERRSELGALQNRLQSAVNNMLVYDENLSAARSRIFDVDMASETAELTKQNILASASTSVLSQANQNNLLALKLLA
ncbi:MAG: flagellin [Bdellovibrionota bacterium]